MNFTLDQQNAALSDMYRVFSYLSIEAQEFFLQKTYELMKERNNSSFYSLASFKTIHRLALDHQVRIKSGSILELGAGKPLMTGLLWGLAGAGKYTSVDKFVRVNLETLWLQRFEALLDMNLFSTEFRLSDFVFRGESGYRLNPARIQLIQGALEEQQLPAESFDFIYSSAVLEHVADPSKILLIMHRLLSPGGLMIHTVDLREHNTNLRTVPDKNTSIEFLKLSKSAWEELYPPGSEHYINRLRASDFENAFRNAGYEIVDWAVTQRMDLCDGVYAELHEDFHKYPLEDLKIMGLRAVLRKS